MNASAIGAAVVIKTARGWAVEYEAIAPYAQELDSVLRTDFHEVLALDLNGTIAAGNILVEPALKTFAPLHGRGYVSGLSKTEADALARAMQVHHKLLKG
jgi:hypothetical protein